MSVARNYLPVKVSNEMQAVVDGESVKLYDTRGYSPILRETIALEDAVTLAHLILSFDPEA